MASSPTVEATTPAGYRAAWPLVLGLIGLDYFSTLAYQPSIAFQAAGLLAPLATAALVLLTLLGALPIYAYVAGKTSPGHGSFALLERNVDGWRGKILILVLLGFCATNFVFTRTLSTADAAVHVVHNPLPAWQAQLDAWAEAGQQARGWIDHPAWRSVCDFWNRQIVLTLLLLLVNFLFWPIIWYGFTKRMVRVSLVLVGLFVLLTLIILASGMIYLLRHDHLLTAWWHDLRAGNWQIDKPVWAESSLGSIIAMSVWLLPKVALGLSGFEMSLIVMPVVRGRSEDDPNKPAGVIGNTRKLLLTAAVCMSVLLIGSALVTTLLLSSSALLTPGLAHERALAYLAHGGSLADGQSATMVNPLFGPAFGTTYDVVTILVLSLAGASVILGLKSVLPEFLMRFGMELRWANAIGFIFIVFNVINLVVTMLFHASVEAQRGAYALSVVTLMAAAAYAVSLDLRRGGGFWRWLRSMPPLLVTIILAAMALAIFIRSPGSLLIAALFIVTIVGSSFFSRWLRATEYRFQGFEFLTERDRLLWDTIRYLNYSVLVPHRPGRHHSLDEKEKRIRERHRIDEHVPVIFLEIVIHDPSDFMHRPIMEIREEGRRYLIRVSRCVSIAHVIVAIGLEFSKVGHPPEIHFGWSEGSAFVNTLKFLLLGEGNIPWLVHDLLRRHEPDHGKRPRVIVG